MAQPVDPKRVRQIYAACIDLDPEDRPAFLDRACAGEPDLRARVEELLLRHSGDFEESHPAETRQTPAQGHPPSGSNQPGVTGLVIGPYIVQRELGRGGMGVVYLADDTRLSRRVALKSLSPGLDAAVGGRERLRNEARMAAALTHPGIATNATGATTAIGTTESSGTSIPAPRLPDVGFVKVDILATGSPVKAWETPISVYFRRQSGGWSLVGLERLPDGR